MTRHVASFLVLCTLAHRVQAYKVSDWRDSGRLGADGDVSGKPTPTSMKLTSMVYNVEYTIQDNPDALGNAADYIVSGMNRGINFISIPEATDKLLHQIGDRYSKSKGHDNFQYKFVFHKTGPNGHALFWLESDRSDNGGQPFLTLENVNNCIHDGKYDHVNPKWLSCEEFAKVGKIVDLDCKKNKDGEMACARPMLLARFSTRDGAFPPIAVASLHAGHTTHMPYPLPKANADLSECWEDACLIAKGIKDFLLDFNRNEFVVLVQGDMNTHMGLHTPDVTLENLLKHSFPVGSFLNGMTKAQFTFDMKGLNDILSPRLNVNFFDTLMMQEKDEVEIRELVEPVTCCRPPWTPWPKFSSEKTSIIDEAKVSICYNFGYGTKTTLSPNSSQEDLDAFETWKQGTDDFAAISIEQWLDSSAFIGEKALALAEEFPDIATRKTLKVGELLELDYVTLTQFKFDHVLVGISTEKYELTTTDYRLGAPQEPASDHKPLEVTMVISTAKDDEA